MKKITLVFLVLLSILPKSMQSQGEGEAIAAVAGGLLAIGAGVAAVEQMKEQAELTATQWILENQPNLESFSLKTLDFDGKKLKDMSSASVMTFKIQEFYFRLRKNYADSEYPHPDASAGRNGGRFSEVMCPGAHATYLLKTCKKEYRAKHEWYRAKPFLISRDITKAEA